MPRPWLIALLSSTVAVAAPRTSPFRFDGMSVSFQPISFGEHRGRWYLAVAADITPAEPLDAGTDVGLKAACLDGERTYLDTTTFLTSWSEVEPGETRRLEMPLYMRAPFAGPPQRCEFTVSWRAGIGGTQSEHSRLCMTGPEIRAGKCYSADESEEVSLDRRSCDVGEPGGCVRIGARYAAGDGVEPDPAYGVSLLFQECEGGQVEACYLVGWMLRDGLGVEPNPQQAQAFFAHACEQGSQDGCAGVAGLALEGRLGKPDPKAAARIYKPLCDNGHALSCHVLGLLTLEGRGVRKNVRGAETLLDRACTLGSGGACLALGDRQSAGPRQGRALAAVSWKKGCAAGEHASCEKSCAAGDESSCPQAPEEPETVLPSEPETAP
ncbi:MAG: hypothetical protein RL653_1377 [Pseudomonadota bacterium]